MFIIKCNKFNFYAFTSSYFDWIYRGRVQLIFSTQFIH